MTARWLGRLVAAALAGTVCSASARADSVADFYRGHPVFVVHSGGEGGGYASYAQVFAPFLAKHLPGHPQVIVQMMPGAGGIREMMHFSSIAPRDGTMVGLVQSGVPFAPLLGTTTSSFDPRKLNWLGAMSRVNAVCASWHESGIHSWQDLQDKTFVVGSSGAGSLTDTQPALLNRLFNTKIKIVSGYNGANEIYLAMERGELQGRCGSGVPSLELARPGWVLDGKVDILVQFGFERGKALANVPTVYELAQNEKVRTILKLALAPVAMNRPMMTTPDVPPERVEALRAAFHAAIEDPEFRTEAQKARLEIEENSAEHVTQLIADAYALPPEIVRDARKAMNVGASE